MSDNRDSRQRGVMVKRLAKAAYDILPMVDRYALGVNSNTGETYLIHNQGVSYQVTHDKPWRFSDYSLLAKWHSLLDIRKLPTEDEVDLADWIDTFGARLETNFRLAYDALTRTDPREKDYNPQVYELLTDVLAKGL